MKNPLGAVWRSRMVHSVVVGQVLTPLNILILALLIEVCVIHPMAANAIRTVVMSPVDFEAQRRVWRKQDAESAEPNTKWQKFRRYLLWKVVWTVSGYILFIGMLSLEIHYTFAYIVSTGIIGGIKPCIYKWIIFPLKRAA